MHEQKVQPERTLDSTVHLEPLDPAKHLLRPQARYKHQTKDESVPIVGCAVPTGRLVITGLARYRQAVRLKIGCFGYWEDNVLVYGHHA